MNQTDVYAGRRAVRGTAGLRPNAFAAVVMLLVEFGLGIWVAIYLTMAQEVSGTHVSTAIGILSGCGSLAGAPAMWAVGRVTRQTASFAIPMSTVALAAVLAALAGWAASRESRKEVMV